ncbi:NUDIX hydrolase [Clostridia bacterium]|nr:NUDIX hydrolase [Clostridia bacterium]
MSNKEYLYQGWLKIFRKQRNGRKYEILESPSAVAAVLLDEEDRILLVKQYRPAVEKMTWEIPAGCLDKPALSPVEVMVEEIEEECALNIQSSDLQPLVSYIPQIGHNYSTMQIFSAKVPSGQQLEQMVDDVDVEKTRWWTMEELKLAIEEGEILDVKTVLAYYCYQNNTASND